MPFSEGELVHPTTEGILNNLIAALKAKFRGPNGEPADTTNGSPARKFIEAFGALPLMEAYQDMAETLRQSRFNSASGQNLRDIAFMYEPKPATRSEGRVLVSFKTVQTSPDPYFVVGDLVFNDTAGQKYDMTADMALPAKSFDSNETGVASNTIDGTRTRIAQRIVLAAETPVQAFGVKVTGTITLTVRLEGDSAGSPDGALVHANLEKTGFSPTTGVFTNGVWDHGAFVAAGTYWLVLTRTAGSATFDGNTGGTANQVKSFTGGSWGLESAVENLNAELVNGGVAELRAQVAGDEGNIDPDSMASVDFASSTVSTRWNSNVGTDAEPATAFTNPEAFTGGQDEEDDLNFRERVRRRLAAKPGCSPDGLVAAVEDDVEGVSSADFLENTDLDAGSTDTVFDGNDTGTASETIDGTTTRIAQKFTITERRFVQYFTAKLNTDPGNDLICTVRIETDAAGSPSGTLVSPHLEETGFDFNGTTETAGTFPQGDYLETGTTYWLVFTRTAGDGTFDGGTTGAAGDVKNYDGTWANDANIDRMNVTVTGGVPGKGVRIFVDGPADADEVAQALWESKPAGIVLDGKDSGTAIDSALRSVTVHYEIPEVVFIYVEATISKTADFVGDADDVRDAIVGYIGGIPVDGGVERVGLRVGFDVIIDQLKAAVLQIPGLVEFTVLKVDIVDPPVATSNVTIAVNQKAKVDDAANDIDITFVNA